MHLIREPGIRNPIADMPDVLNYILSPIIAIVLMVAIVRQCRKPWWFPGRLFLQNMNVRHAPVTNWGLSHVAIEPSFTILDVGCGGGRTIETLSSIATEGKVYGVDYSTESVATSRRTNATRIAEGRVDVRVASVSNLGFPNDMFDLVTAVETHYYWPDMVKDLKEILRVLKPGGRVVIIAETYKGRSADWAYRPAMGLLGATYLTVDEHRDVLARADYSDIQVFEERSKGWICAVGRKPETD